MRFSLAYEMQRPVIDDHAVIEETLEHQKSALFLMPEIGLTPRTAQEFRERLGGRVAILHSRLRDGERFD